MPVLVEDPCRLLVQGLGRDGSFQAQRIVEYGTNMVAAVHPNRAGTKFMDEVPYFETAREAIAATGANTGLVFVPAPFAMDAILEQADAGLSLIVCITEGVPVHDMMKAKAYLDRTNSRLLGPNCPGLIHPGERIKLGIIPGVAVSPGNVGVVSRSGTLTYEAVAQLGAVGMGQSTCVGIGGDPIPGTNFIDVLTEFQDDHETEAIVMIGEIGGTREQAAADFIKQHVTKPVVASIAGQTAPPGKRMGHAGAIITGKAGLASEKNKALEAAGATVVESPAYIGEAMANILG